MYRLGEVDPTFLRELWIWYSVGEAVLVLRMIVRLRSVGFKGFQGDDVFAMLLIVFCTVDSVMVHNIYYLSTNVEGSIIQTMRKLSEGEIAQLRDGSKQQLATWYTYLGLVWCLKGTMVCFFRRLTLGLDQYRIVNYIGIACIVSFIAVLLTITFGCFPTSHNWQVVPDPGKHCTLKPQNFYVMTVLNILTDAAILSVPLPLLWNLHVPLKRKLALGILLSSGVFVITAAIVRTVSTLAAHPSALVINRWGVRESVVGIIAVNVPVLRPIFSPSFWKHGQATQSASGGHTPPRNLSNGVRGPYEMTTSINGGDEGAKSHGDRFHSSEEHIISQDNQRKPGGQRKNGDLMIQTTYEITSEERADRDMFDGGMVSEAAYNKGSIV